MPTTEHTLNLENLPSFEQFWAWFVESNKKADQRKQEFDQQMQESREKFDREMAELREQSRETDRRLKKTDKIIGDLGNRFGELVEHLVAPSIKEKFNELGFAFTRSSLDVEIDDPDNTEDKAEVDILLENGEVVIAVEVKSKANQEDVAEHIERMAKLRRYASHRQDNRRYQGAVASAILSDSMRKYILRKGFYPIEQTGDTVRIAIPKGFTPKVW